jgi:acetyl-CoA synthetase
VTTFYTAPTAIRTFMKWGDEFPARHDLSSLRLLGSVGEPINPEAWVWYYQTIGGARCPVVDTWWQTETGAIMISPLPGATTLKPGSATFPLPGIQAGIVDDAGAPVGIPGGGYLTLDRPWPSMLRGIWGDPQRYLDTYWSRFDGVWVHGDWAYADPQDDLWYVLGRSDDTIKVAGKRLGPAEVESVLVSHTSVAESAAIGVPDELKGEALVCFVVLRKGKTASAELAQELSDLIATALGKPLRPKAVHFVSDLPRTRNAKILRRVVRSVYTGKDPGDLSSLENPSALAAIGATRD